MVTLEVIRDLKGEASKLTALAKVLILSDVSIYNYNIFREGGESDFRKIYDLLKNS